jgi:HD superfamily phosphohydrolase
MEQREPGASGARNWPGDESRRVVADAMPPLWEQPRSTASLVSAIAGEADEPAVVIRDSLYERIALSPLALALVDTPPFLRLQGIKQLGFVYRVWPGATHTRYEHSLGVYHLARLALGELVQRGGIGQSVTPEDAQTFLAAALLHDIGHYPFSHAIEELGYPIEPHERVGRHIILQSPIAEVLERHRVAPERVAALVDPPRTGARGNGPAGGRAGGSAGMDSVLIQLLSGTLDVDKLDYLPRDARACNVPYGGVDVTRLLAALRVQSVAGRRQLVVTDKGISPLHSLLHARQEMFDNVYWHHTNRAQMAMLLRAVQDAILAGTLTPAELTSHDDAALLALLDGPTMPPATRALVGGLRQRRIYKTALEVSARAGRVYQQLDALFWDQAKRRRAELALAEHFAGCLGEPVADYEVLIDIPKPEKWEMHAWIRFSNPPLGMESLLSWVEATGLLPGDLGKYEQYQRRIRIVTSARLREVARGRPELILPVLDRLAVL